MSDASDSPDASLCVKFVRSAAVRNTDQRMLQMHSLRTYQVNFPFVPSALSTSKRKLQSLRAGNFLVRPFAARSRPNIWDLGADCLEARNTPFGLNFRERRPL